MIFNGLITFAYTIANFILGIFPEANVVITAQITQNLSGFRSALSTISWFFPVNTALLFLVTIFTIEASIFLFKLVRWVASMVSVGIVK